jgi:cytochrome oxidase Cu insertion factor (SCO1/SenC/PrrC family)
MSAKTRVKTAPGRARRRSGRTRAAGWRGRRLALGSGLLLVVLAALAVFLISGGGGSGSRDAPADAAQPVGAVIGIDPEQIKIGKPFPGFTVTDANGGVLATRESLSGKPTIIWFTTSYCLPCQVGAEEVARLDDELGGKAFNVLVAFVDPTEPPAVLQTWREQFGRPDWIVSIDRGTAFAEALGVVALDTKFLLDAGGVLEDGNAYQVDDTYLALLRRTVQASK